MAICKLGTKRRGHKGCASVRLKLANLSKRALLEIGTAAGLGSSSAVDIPSVNLETENVDNGRVKKVLW